MEAALDLLHPAREVLAGVTLAEYLATQPPRAVMSITSKDTLGQVLHRFASASLVAAPCFSDDQRTFYRGFLDLLDIVAAVVEAARAAEGSGSGSGSPRSLRHQKPASLRHHAAAAARALAERPVGGIRASANDAQLVYQAQLGSTLLEVVCQGFAHPVDQRACHRLAVFQPSNDWDDHSMGTADDACLQLTNIVSQSDILRFMCKHRERLGRALLEATLEQLGVREKRVLCVPSDMAVIDALAGMVDSRVPAVAVIDSLDSGRLEGNLSISDLRGLHPSHFEQLAQPVGEFLRDGWLYSPHWQPSSPRGGVAAEFGVKSPEVLPHAPALATCTLGSRFGQVLRQLADGHLHRMFLVDGEGRPVGVVSLTDILRLLAA